MAAEQTEKASPRRKERARERGDIVRSRELTAAVGTVAGVLMLGAMSAAFIHNWGAVFERTIAIGGRTDLDFAAGNRAWTGISTSMLAALGPPLLVLAACAIASFGVGMAQVGGFAIRPESLRPQLAKVSPVTNLKNLFSLRSTARLAKSLIPGTVVFVLGMRALERQMSGMPVLSLMRLSSMFTGGYGLMVQASIVMVGWAALDYAVERRSWEQRLRMSKQEIRDEMKETEGNPQIKRRIRSIQRQMRHRRMQSDVRRASVVITNPNHYAVALDFDFDTMQAPTVLAKGQNLIAEEIKQEARWAGVPIVENPPLARSLYRSVEPGQSIPEDLYAAVAAILAFLYRQRVEEKMRQERIYQERMRRDRKQQTDQASGAGNSAPRLRTVWPDAGVGEGSSSGSGTNEVQP